MRGVRLVKCKTCRFYMIDGISKRCTKDDNRYTNWLGLMYKKHPEEINLRGNCENYEKFNK